VLEPIESARLLRRLIMLLVCMTIIELPVYNLKRNTNLAASTQNQAFRDILFFYKAISHISPRGVNS
jgi:hypothetical protein